MENVLITGASSGIGRQLATLFAADGADVILVARREAALNELAAQLRRDYQVQATVIPVDLAQVDAAVGLCETLRQRGLHVDVLVNNAGFGALGKLVELEAAHQTDMIQVNITALTQLTRLLLPAMVANGGGGILNVGSIAAYQAGPNMTVYYATKAYVLSFSEGLREEVSGQGVTVTCLAPGPTETEFGSDSGMAELGIFATNMMSVEAVARAGYRGFRKNKAVVIPGLVNKLIVLAVKWLPRVVTRKLVGVMQQTPPPAPPQ